MLVLLLLLLLLRPLLLLPLHFLLLINNYLASPLRYEQAALDTEALCLCTTDIVEGIQPNKGLDIDEGSYEPDEYVTTGTVNQLHSLYLTGSSDFDPTDLEYAKRIAAFFAFTIVFGVLSIIIMWCNGCCSNLNCHRHHCACCYRMGKRNGKILTIFVLLLSGGTMMGSYVPPLLLLLLLLLHAAMPKTYCRCYRYRCGFPSRLTPRPPPPSQVRRPPSVPRLRLRHVQPHAHGRRRVRGH